MKNGALKVPVLSVFVHFYRMTETDDQNVDEISLVRLWTIQDNKGSFTLFLGTEKALLTYSGKTLKNSQTIT